MDVEGQSKCPGCQRPSDDLYHLSCNHPCCALCLKSRSKQIPGGHRIICPECNRATSLPEGVISGLMHDFNSIVEKKRSCSNSPEGIGTTNNSCQFCKCDIGTFWCVECKRNLCKTCAEKHQQRSVFRHHQLQETIGTRTMNVKCDIHEERRQYYCYECATTLCALCLQDEDHPHPVVTFQKISNEVKERLQSAHSKITPLTNDLEAIQEALFQIDYPNLLKKHYNDAVSLIRSVAHRAIEDIKEREQSIIDSLTANVDTKRKTYDLKVDKISFTLKEGTVSQEDVDYIKAIADRLVEFVPGTVIFVPTGKKLEPDLGEIRDVEVDFERSEQQSVKPKSSPVQLELKSRSTECRTYETIKIEPESLSKPQRPPKPKSSDPHMKLKPTPCAAVCHNFESMETQLKVLTKPHAQPTWQLSTFHNQSHLIREIDYSTMRGLEGGIKPEVLAIAFGPDRSVIASDVQNGVLMHFTLDGAACILVSPGTLQPRGLAVSRDGKIYTCDANTRTIWTFSLRGERPAKWSKKELSSPRGICVLQNGHIVVSDRDLCKLFIYDTKGQLVRSFGKKGSYESQLKCPGSISTDTSGRILVCDNGNHAIKIFTPNGIFITTIPLQEPNDQDVLKHHSVCTDALCNIYITQKSSGEVMKLDKNGVYLGPILDSHGPYNVEGPVALAMDNSGLIAVSELTQQRRCIKIIKLL